jgi:hypothetical protein
MMLSLRSSLLALLPCCSAPLASAQLLSDSTPEAVAYATFGIVIAQNVRLDELRLTDAQFDAFIDGIRRFRSKHPPPSLTPEAETILETIRQRVSQLQESAATTPPAKQDPLRTYLTEIRARLNLHETDSGLLHRLINGGVGPRPRPADTVILDIVAKAPDLSTELPQLSRKDARIKVHDLLPGLAEGVQMLTLGSSQLLVLPPHLSFDHTPWPEGLQRGMPLIFQITLKDISPTSASAP